MVKKLLALYSSSSIYSLSALTCVSDEFSCVKINKPDELSENFVATFIDSESPLFEPLKEKGNSTFTSCPGSNKSPGSKDLK